MACWADEILRRQGSDGAIVLKETASAHNRVVPYFANLAAIGLVSAYQATGQDRYLVAARHWSDWYAAHMNRDGTVYDYSGSTGTWHSDGSYDSTDSYAATWLELLDLVGVQNKAWASVHYAAAARAVAAIRLTLQPDGLTLAKPGWPVAYTMDNVETARGLRAAARLAAWTGHRNDAAPWTAMAARMEAAIDSNLWDHTQMNYCVGIQADGGRIEAHDKWYPDLMANLMAIGWQRASDRNRSLYQHLAATRSATIPAKANTEENIEHLVWWGFAAVAAGDSPRLKAIQTALMAMDPKAIPITNTALLGQVCRLLALNPGSASAPEE
jgi:hypothetical protein